MFRKVKDSIPSHCFAALVQTAHGSIARIENAGFTPPEIEKSCRKGEGRYFAAYLQLNVCFANVFSAVFCGFCDIFMHFLL
jgi:hypothetical protein